VPDAHTIVVDHLGRPPTTNRLRTVHYRVRAATDKEWRDAGCILARQAKVPKMSACTVSVHGRYPTRSSLPDLDGIAPALKAVLDGIVDAGVLTDDRYPFVQRITYDPPVIAKGQPAALVVTLTPTEN
jgi:Holliday junction resolvase RusA-like endonuclease